MPCTDQCGYAIAVTARLEKVGRTRGKKKRKKRNPELYMCEMRSAPARLMPNRSLLMQKSGSPRTFGKDDMEYVCAKHNKFSSAMPQALALTSKKKGYIIACPACGACSSSFS